MIVIVLLSIYLFFCFLVARAAKNVTIGFFGVFVFSIFLTPLLAAIVVLIFKGKAKKKKKGAMEELEEEYLIN